MKFLRVLCVFSFQNRFPCRLLLFPFFLGKILCTLPETNSGNLQGCASFKGNHSSSNHPCSGAKGCYCWWFRNADVGSWFIPFFTRFDTHHPIPVVGCLGISEPSTNVAGLDFDRRPGSRSGSALHGASARLSLSEKSREFWGFGGFFPPGSVTMAVFSFFLGGRLVVIK